MSSDPAVTLLAFTSTEQFFHHLGSLLDYASANARNESSIYGALSFVLTVFCTSARVTATKLKNLYLGTFPQKDLKISKTKQFRAPDFSVIVVQSRFGVPVTENQIGDIGALIWEAKASPENLTWFGQERSEPQDLPKAFISHFPQICAQAVFANTKFNQKAIYAFLSVDIWFMLFCFPDGPPAVTWNKHGQPRLGHKTYLEFDRYMIIPPARMVNGDCIAFSPEFLHALKLSVGHLTDMTVIPHPFFSPPPGVEELVSEQLKRQRFRTKIEEETRQVEIDNRFALGEDSETDREHQAHPAVVPTTLDHFLTSPRKTRSQTAAQASTQSGTNAQNTAGTSRSQNPGRGGNARQLRPRRKVEMKTGGSQKTNE